MSEGLQVRRGLSLYGVVRGCLIVLLGVVVFANTWGHVVVDIKPEVYLAPLRMLSRFSSAWLFSPYLGNPNFNVGLSPVLVVTGGLDALGLSPQLIFRVFHFALWLVAGAGASRLLRTLEPGVSRWAGLTAAVVYLANPYTLTAGATLAIALPLAFLPWTLVFLVRALREPSTWVWPAAFGLAFFAMSGMNAGVVPLLGLLAVVPTVWAVAAVEGTSWKDIAKVLSRCALFCVGVSIYWLAPSLAAYGTGSAIVTASESPEGIARVSSYMEVLRGLGQWTLYGRGTDGPWVPEFAVYLTDPVVILFSILLPALALLALRWSSPRVGRLTFGLVAIAAPVMVGLFPGNPESPFGRALAWGFDHVPGLVAFRTTNKIGALLVLGFALSLGYAVPLWWSRLRRWGGLRQFAVGAAATMCLMWTLPAFTGNLYISTIEVPGYWRDAAAAMDKGDPGTRVLVLPGQTRSHYRWTDERPDDVLNSLMDRQAVLPETTPNTSAPGANLLAALDDSVQSGDPPERTLSTYAHYLGVGSVLLRHDVVWEDSGGASPGTMERVVRGDPGLAGVGNFGEPGENVGGTASGGAESILPPLQWYDVRQPRQVVRAASAAGWVSVAGDGWAVPAMVRSGALADSPPFRYAMDVTADEWDSAPPSRLVLTDTNQRRETFPFRLVAGQGALLTEDQDAEVTRTLGSDPSDQTVLRTEGVRAVASSEGGVFMRMPYAAAANAIDGNPDTSWLFGDFGRAPGESLVLHLPQPTRLDEMTIDQAEFGPVRLGEITVTAGSFSGTVDVSPHKPASIDLGGVVADEVTLEVDSVQGEGYNLVGISEIELEGLRAERIAVMPRSLTTLRESLSVEQQEVFSNLPLDVLMTRVRNGSSPTDDTETDLQRDFELPDPRTLEAAARVRVTDLEGTYNRLAGLRPDSVRSSGFYFDSSQSRALNAADGDPATGWTPARADAGAWWRISTRPRTVGSVLVQQDDPRGLARGQAVRRATRAVVRVDDAVVWSGRIGRGPSQITFPAVTGARQVEVRFSRWTGEAGDEPAQFTTIDTGRQFRLPGQDRCLAVATLDGTSLLMRPRGDAELSEANAAGSAWAGCSPVRLAAGGHELRSVPAFVLDSMDLHDVTRARSADVPAPTVSGGDPASSRQTVHVGQAEAPYFLVLGQGYDERWRATIDGRDLGDPILVDGYSSGWLITDLDSHDIVLAYAPQRWTQLALAGSVATVLLAGFLVLRRRLRPPGAVTSAAPEGDPAGRSAGSRRRRPSRAGAFGWVALAGVAVGLPGLVGAAIVVALRRAGAARALPWLGAALIVVAPVVYILVAGSRLSDVGETTVADAMWPHRVAAVGLVVALGAPLARPRGFDDEGGG